MEYIAPLVFIAIFIGFIAYRVKKSQDRPKGSGKHSGGGGTGRRTEEK